MRRTKYKEKRSPRPMWGLIAILLIVLIVGGVLAFVFLLPQNSQNLPNLPNVSLPGGNNRFDSDFSNGIEGEFWLYEPNDWSLRSGVLTVIDTNAAPPYNATQLISQSSLSNYSFDIWSNNTQYIQLGLNLGDDNGISIYLQFGSGRGTTNINGNVTRNVSLDCFTTIDTCSHQVVTSIQVTEPTQRVNFIDTVHIHTEVNGNHFQVFLNDYQVVDEEIFTAPTAGVIGASFYRDTQIERITVSN